MQPAHQKENIIMMEYWHYLGGVNMEDREVRISYEQRTAVNFLKLAFLNVR